MGNSGLSSNITNSPNYQINCLSSKLQGTSSWSSFGQQHEDESDSQVQPSFLSSNRLNLDLGLKKRRNLGSLATLRKKLRKGRRRSKNLDHVQVIRDFISVWTTRDLMQLTEEYEATSLCKELYIQAEIARPSASTVSCDLTELFVFSYVADINLLFKGHQFPVHKAILCARCPLFRELLGKINEFGACVAVNFDIPSVDVFSDLLRFLYSGELYSTSLNPSASSTYKSILMSLSDQVPNSLDQDLKHLLETGIYSDAILVFSPSQLPNSDYLSSQTNSSILPSKKCKACSDQSEYSCHSAILGARSTFFKNVISRHQKRFTEVNSDNKSTETVVNTANQKIKIVLDESIIPRRFARIILHCMYRDSIDLINLLPGCLCKCLSFPQELGHSSSKSNSNSNSYLSPSVYAKEIMELYEIGRFLELDFLIQSCEDLIIDCLSIETLVTILKWSEQPHGSPWVKRQSLCFLREEFSAIASSSYLYQLEVSHLIEAIKSDFLQASELEVLQAIIKWGENRLIKQMEDCEPNVISQTTHSLRHGLRKKELNDGDLRDIISELMPYLRVGHILPPDCETLTNALKRGLISTLPPYMLGEDSLFPYSRGISCWLRGRESGVFVRPRYFSLYVEEAKNILDLRLSRQTETLPNRSSRSISQIPDTLYMVDKNSSKALSVASFNDFFANYSTSPCQEYSSNISQMPVIEQRIIVLMKQREQELKRMLCNHKNLHLIFDKNEVMKYIQLRVVREFGLPDAGQEAFTYQSNYMPYSGPENTSNDIALPYDESGMISNSKVLSDLEINAGAGIKSEKKIYDFNSEAEIETQSQMNSNQPPSDTFVNDYCSESEYLGTRNNQLSNVIPDIALATSAMVELHLIKTSNEFLVSQPTIPQPHSPESFHEWKA